MNKVLEALEVIKAYFEDPKNFETTKDKLQGILVSNMMDAICEDFIKTYIEPEVKKQRETDLVVDVGAKA